MELVNIGRLLILSRFLLIFLYCLFFLFIINEIGECRWLILYEFIGNLDFKDIKLLIFIILFIL